MKNLFRFKTSKGTELPLRECDASSSARLMSEGYDVMLYKILRHDEGTLLLGVAPDKRGRKL